MKGYEALRDMAENPGKVYRFDLEEYSFVPTQYGEFLLAGSDGGYTYLSTEMLLSDLWEPVQ